MKGANKSYAAAKKLANKLVSEPKGKSMTLPRKRKPPKMGDTYPGAWLLPNPGGPWAIKGHKGNKKPKK